MAGEIHGLVGENGAGKSTLMKIIAGVHHGFEGEMRVDGRAVHLRSPRDALAAGIGMVHQELSIVRRSDRRRKRLPRRAAADRRRHGRLGAHEARGEDAARQPRPRHRSARPAWAACRSACSSWSNCRACCFPAPGSSFSTSRPRRCRRRKWRGCSTCCAGCRGEGPQPSSSSRISSTTCWRFPTGSRCSATAARLSTEAYDALDKDSVIGHMIGRGSAEMHMGESAELTGDDARPVVLAVETASATAR